MMNEIMQLMIIVMGMMSIGFGAGELAYGIDEKAPVSFVIGLSLLFVGIVMVTVGVFG